MKSLVAIAAFAVVALSASATYADPVSDCSFTPVPKGDAYSILFDSTDGFFADLTTPFTCPVTVPANPLNAGEIGVYKVDYRGGLSLDATGHMVVTTGGHVVSVDITTNDEDSFDGYFFSDYFRSDGSALNSSVTLSLPHSGYPDGQFVLDTIDYLLVRATISDLQSSIDQLAGDRTSVVTHLNATADLLSGVGQPLEGDDGFGAVGGIGSVTVGVSGRKSLDDGFSLLGGMAFVDQTAGGASTDGLVFSGSARYLTPGADTIRPFGEVGLHAAPALSLSFSRDYATSIGTVSTTGNAQGNFFGGYIRGGVLFAPDPTNDVVFAATLGKDWLSTGAYTETFSGSNLFAASAPAQTGNFDTIKIGADWTTRMVPQLDLTFSAAVGRTIAENAVATDVAFAGSFTGAPRSENFVEYGVRASRDIQPGANLGAFVHGATGEYSGTHVQVGGDIHVSF